LPFFKSSSDQYSDLNFHSKYISCFSFIQSYLTNLFYHFPIPIYLIEAILLIHLIIFQNSKSFIITNLEIIIQCPLTKS
jgi:hypothetical protein